MIALLFFLAGEIPTTSCETQYSDGIRRRTSASVIFPPEVPVSANLPGASAEAVVVLSLCRQPGGDRRNEDF